MYHDTTGTSDIRLAELMAALSLATDLGMGQPLEWALCACVLGVRLGDALGMSEAELRVVYYQALLRYIGCNADMHLLAAIVGDEIAPRMEIAAVDSGSLPQVLALMTRYITLRRANAPTAAVLPDLLRGLVGVARMQEEFFTSGYQRGAPAAMLAPAARMMAAADAYHAMTEPRPPRAALAPERAASELWREARAGRLDADAVEAVLAAAGHRVPKARRELVAGLSAREIEVLRLIARGHSMAAIAAKLSVSKKTVDNHIQHIYAKIGVSTRAGATLFAMKHALL
jgi:DNA-binding NarL/FixJ family response regulator